METEKNLHASIPDAFLIEAQQQASASHITVDEWVQDAMERRLRECRREDIFAYGRQQAQKLGIKEQDVERIVHEFREEERQGNYDHGRQ